MIAADNGELSARLRSASYNGDVGEVKLLLSMGADPMESGLNGQNSIHLAAMGGRSDVCEALLLSNGFESINSTDENGRTPMLLAARNGMIDCIQTLAFHGANPLVTDSFGQTPFDVARDQRVRILLDTLSFIAKKSGMTRDADKP